MLKIDFTTEDLNALHYERFHHPHPRVQMRAEVVFLQSQGFAQGFIARQMRLSRNTVATYLRAYRAGGLSRLKEVRWHKPHSALEPHRASLEDHCAAHPPATLNRPKPSLRLRPASRVPLRKCAPSSDVPGCIAGKSPRFLPKLTP